MPKSHTVGRALLVGAVGDTSDGVGYDIRVMRDLLCDRNFAVDIRVGKDATRAGILAGYDRLIAEARPDEPSVFYYTGHGFRGAAALEQGRYWQAICPTDVHASTTTDFRGITSWELSIKQAQLTARTRNVTVILDCCYAAQMSRDGAASGAVPRALPYPSRLGFDAHLQMLQAQYGRDFDAVDPVSNRNAVRLVASAQDECAVMYPVNGEYRGAFTEALVAVLREVGDAQVSWAWLIHAIRVRVRRRSVIQRPDVEGPADRCPFSVRTAESGEAVPVTGGHSGLRIAAGELQGVGVGDVFGVMPAGAQSYREAEAIVEATVYEVCPLHAAAKPGAWKHGNDALPAGAVAIPIEKAATRHAVRIVVPDGELADVTAAIAATPTLRVAAADEVGALATLQLVGEALTIEDALGPLFPEARFPEQLGDAVKDLANLGSAARLRELEGEHGVNAGELAIEWGVVEQGQLRRMPEHGCALGLGDRIYVKVKSTAQRELCVHIFNIGVRGKISLLTRADPAGVFLNAERSEFVLGQRFDQAPVGCPLSWPKGLPRETFPRLDELIVIAIPIRTSLASLETQEQLVRGRAARSKLDDLLAQVHDGLPRNLRGGEPIAGFFLKRLSYLLHPREAAMADLAFEIDDNPLRQGAARAVDAWVVPREGSVACAGQRCTISIQITDLVIDGQPTGGDVRVHGLICTRSAGDAPGHRAWTRRSWREADERRSSDDPVVFQGQVQGFVDIDIWVSRDERGGQDLAKLLERCATRADYTDAARALSEAAGPSPWIAAVGASAAMSRIAHECLSDTSSAARGLYRTSLLVDELLRTRAPFARHCRTRDVSFTLRVEPSGTEANGS